MPPLGSIDGHSTSMHDDDVDCLLGTESQHKAIDRAISATPINQSRTVTFNKKIRVKGIPNREKYTREIMDMIWYTSDDYKCMKLDVRSTMKKMIRYQQGDEEEKSIINSDPNYCIRGIEDRLPEKYRERASTKRAIVWTVLQEQENQRNLGVPNPSRISLVYRSQSNRNVATSKRRAAIDAEDVKAYYNI
jgi:hypothetical protein